MITVVFGKNGYHHVSVGRLGTREPERGIPYELPDAFRAHLPKTAHVFDLTDEADKQRLDDLMYEFDIRRPLRPLIVDQEALDSLVKSHAQRSQPEDMAGPASSEPATDATAAPEPRRRQRRAA